MYIYIYNYIHDMPLVNHKLKALLDWLHVSSDVQTSCINWKSVENIQASYAHMSGNAVLFIYAIVFGHQSEY